MPFGDAVSNLVAVGTVDHRSARLWARAERPGDYLLTVSEGPAVVGTGAFTIDPTHPLDHTAALSYPDDFPGAAPLQPLHRYHFKITSVAGDVFVGAGQFETAPADPASTPDHFSIGVMSCHQPFSSEGALSERNMRLLEGLPAAFTAHDIKLLIAAGDQIYADAPAEFSLTNAHYLQSRWPGRGQLPDWAADEIRALYQERYRICWNQRPLLKLMSSFPTYAILDDHEVFDDWGSEAAHDTPPYQKVIGAARRAYMDYQGSRQLAWGPTASLRDAFDYEFRYGSVAGFVFDLRSERTVGPPAQVISAGQLDRFRQFLDRNVSAQVILMVTSVPLVHLPEWLTAAGVAVFGTKVDFPDHWSAPANREQRLQILELMRNHLQRPQTANQKLVVIGGDVHVGAAFSMTFVGPNPKVFYELTTSAVSNRVKPLEADISVLGPAAFAAGPRTAGGTLEVRLLPGAAGAPARNPIGGLNAGVIEFQRHGAATQLRFKLLGYDDKLKVGDQFQSGWL
jgi:alkaline phosphatase D